MVNVITLYLNLLRSLCLLKENINDLHFDLRSEVSTKNKSEVSTKNNRLKYIPNMS